MTLLTDDQWEQLQRIPQVGRAHRIGRRPAEDRQLVEAALWVMWHQARWRDLPLTYPSPRTCQRRLRLWREENAWPIIWNTYIDTLDEQATRQWGEVLGNAILVQAGAGQPAPGASNDPRIGRPPFWLESARQFLKHTADRQPPQLRTALAPHIEVSHAQIASRS